MTIAKLRQAIEATTAHLPHGCTADKCAPFCPRHHALAALDELEGEREEGIPQKILNWGNAYPENVFPKPTKAQYAELHTKLKEVGLTLDLFSADTMRHVITRVIEILKDPPAPSDDEAAP